MTERETAAASARPLPPYPISEAMREVFKGGRPLAYTMDEYWNAPGSGPLNYTWKDKPHRVVYDLLAAIIHLQAILADRAASAPQAVRMLTAYEWRKVLREFGPYSEKFVFTEPQIRGLFDSLQRAFMSANAGKTIPAEGIVPLAPQDTGEM